jgi:hypothetical protein
MTQRGRVLYVLPSIPDDAPEQLKNALAIRNACATEGVCPDCGVVGVVVADELPGLFHLVFRHEDDCAVLRDPEAA